MITTIEWANNYYLLLLLFSLEKEFTLKPQRFYSNWKVAFNFIEPEAGAVYSIR